MDNRKASDLFPTSRLPELLFEVRFNLLRRRKGTGGIRLARTFYFCHAGPLHRCRVWWRRSLRYLFCRDGCGLKINSAWKEDVVLKVNVLVEIVLKVFEPVIERVIGRAGIGGGNKVVA